MTTGHLRWWESSLYRPVSGQRIYLWDAVNKKRISTISADDDEWFHMYPRWAYSRSGFDPVKRVEIKYDSQDMA